MFIAWRTALIPENKLVGRERDRFSDIGRGESFFQRNRGGFGGLCRRGFENRLAELIQPGVIARARAGFPVEQTVLFEQLGQQSAWFLHRRAAIPRFRLHAVPHRLPKHGVRMFASNHVE